MSVARSSGFTARARSRYAARRGSVSTAAPRASSSAIVRSAPAWRSAAKVMTWRSAGRVARTSVIFAACAASLTKMATAPASRRMYAACSAGRLG